MTLGSLPLTPAHPVASPFGYPFHPATGPSTPGLLACHPSQPSSRGGGGSLQPMLPQHTQIQPLPVPQNCLASSCPTHPFSPVSPSVAGPDKGRSGNAGMAPPSLKLIGEARQRSGVEGAIRMTRELYQGGGADLGSGRQFVGQRSQQPSSSPSTPLLPFTLFPLSSIISHHSPHPHPPVAQRFPAFSPGPWSPE